MKSLFTLFAIFAFFAVNSPATQIYFPIVQMTGTTNDVTLNVRAVNNPVIWNNQFHYLPRNGTNFSSTNGFATNSFVPGNYTVAILGLPRTWSIYVTNTTDTLNAVDISTGITIYSGLQTLAVYGSGWITNDGRGNYSVSITNTGGGGGVDAATVVAIGATNFVDNTNGIGYGTTLLSSPSFSSPESTNTTFRGTGTKFGLTSFPDIDSSIEEGWLQIQADGKFQRTFDASSLTNLNASELRSGTLPDARFSSAVTLDAELNSASNLLWVAISTNTGPATNLTDLRYLRDASGTALDSVAPSRIGEWAFTQDGLLARGYGTSTGEWRKYIVVSGSSGLVFFLGPVEIQGDSLNITGGYIRARDSSDYHVLQSSGNNNVLYLVNTNAVGPHGTVAMQILATQTDQRAAGVVHEFATGIFGDSSAYSSNAHTALMETALIAGLESGGQVGPDQHSKSNMLKSAEMIRSQTRFDQTGTSNQISHFLDETTTNLHYKIYAWETGSDSKTNRPVAIIDVDRTNFSVTVTSSLTATGAVVGASFSGVGSSLTALNDDNVNFDDGDGLWTATTIGAAFEEMNDSINSGVPNGTGAKLHWSQLLGVPAGFADNIDDGGGGGGITSLRTNGTDFGTSMTALGVSNTTTIVWTGYSNTSAGTYTADVAPNSIGGTQLTIDATAESEIEAVVDLSALQGNLPVARVDTSALSDTELLYNNAGVVGTLPQSTFQASDADLTDLADGSLTGSKVGSGINGDNVTTGTIGIARGGTGASLADPNADRILFWDDSAGAFDFLTAGSGLSISGTTITATGGGVTNFVLTGNVVQGYYPGTGAVGFTMDADNNQLTIASEDGNVQIAVANSGITMVGTVATITATTANVTTVNNNTNSAVQAWAGDLTVTNTLTTSVLNTDTLNVTNANIQNYNVENFNATNSYFQTLYATNSHIQTNLAAVTSLTNAFVVGTRYTNAAHRALVSASFHLISAVGGTPKLSLKVEQGNGITNIYTIQGLTNIVQTTMMPIPPAPVGPTARYTFVDESSGGASAAIITATSSYNVW